MPEMKVREEVFLSFYKDNELVAIEGVGGRHMVKKAGWKDTVGLFGADKPDSLIGKSTI